MCYYCCNNNCGTEKKLKETLINSVQSPKLLWDFFIKLSVDKSDNTMYNKISNINPFLYRGYYYDRETGLYYLNTRYYDPETGRFINADDIANLDTKSINGLNLYIYCGNNSIKYIDPSGCSYMDKNFDKWGTVSSYIEYVMATSLIMLNSLAGKNSFLNSILPSISKSFEHSAAILGYIGIGVNTIVNIVHNIKNNAGVLRTTTDAIVDIGVGLGTIWAGATIGSAIGSFLPGLGTAVGFIVGMGIGLFMYFIGDEWVQNIKDFVYDNTVELRNWATETSVKGTVKLTNFFTKTTNKIGKWFVRLFC